jgi:pyruvate dehydrogenase E2 component (dihydrolipoamide acetyltransferase)
MAHAQTSSNPNDFILPDLGEGVHEAELIKWRVSVGQLVKEHDILAEMETDKALVEVPSPRTGVIAALHGSEGEILHVGNALVTFEGSGDGGSSAQAEPKANANAKGDARSATAADTEGCDGECDMGAQINELTKHVPQNGSHPPAHAEHREDAGTVVGAVGGALGGVTAEAGKALATPAVRRLARDLGVDIDGVRGTGLAGRVTEKDVRAASGGARTATPAAKAAPSRSAPAPTREPAPARPPAKARDAKPLDAGPSADPLRTPFRGVRRTIANRLRESVNRAVHFNVMDEADVSALDVLRRKLAAASGEKVSFLPFVASAVCRVLLREEFRSLNSTVDEKPEDGNYDAAILTHRTVHIGIAVETPNGLMVPVVRDCDALGVLEIGRTITSVASAARDRSIAREDLSGSTFTISNVGSHAGRFATPIINYPEVGILAVGRGRQSPVIRNTPAGPAFAIGQLLPLSLACDHRVVDGATAALALAEIVRLLQEPEGLMGPARG